MSYFGLNQTAQNQALDEAARSKRNDDSAGFFDGAFTAPFAGMYTGLVAKPDQALWGLLDATVSPVARELNEQFDINDTSEQFIKNQRKLAEQQIRQLTPDRGTTGTAGQVLFSLFDIGSQAAAASFTGGALGSALTVGGLQGFSDYEKSVADGVAPGVASEKAFGEGVFAAGGVFIPMSLGLRGGGAMAESVGNQLLVKGGSLGKPMSAVAKATPDVLFASGSNVVMGMAQRGYSAKVLSDAGYKELAAQYDVFDKQSMAIDAVLGVAFGGIGRYINSRGESMPLLEYSGPQIDAALTANQHMHMDLDTAPGLPVNAMSLDGHVQAMRKAMNDLAMGDRVDIGSILDDAQFMPVSKRTLLDTSIREAAGVIDEGSSLSMVKDIQLKELSEQLISRGERESLMTSIHDLNYRIDQKTSEISAISNQEITGSGRRLSRDRTAKQSELRRLDNELSSLKNELKIKQQLADDNLPGGRFYEAKAELSRRKLAAEQSEEALMNYFSTPKPRDRTQITSDEIMQAETLVRGDRFEDIDSEVLNAEIAIKNNPDLEIDFIDEAGNSAKVKASELYSDAVKQADDAQNDAGLFDVAVNCFLGR